VLLVPRLLVAAATVTETAYTDMPMPMTELLRVAQQGGAFARRQRQQLESAGRMGAENVTLRIDQDGRLWMCVRAK
jgi:hypothetical protein